MDLKRIAFIITVFCHQVTYAQKEAAQWRFGYRAGLDFQLGTPLPVLTNSANAQWWSSSIADPSGNLLFYCAMGGIVYSNNNDTMAGGMILAPPGGTSINSTIILPKTLNRYYLISIGNLLYFQNPIPPMLTFSEIDMNLASGLGSVVATNIPISAVGLPLTNKLTVTRHCNGNDYWILTHKGGYPGSNQFYAYLVSNSGISVNPIISTVGSNQTQAYAPASQTEYWTHKFSPNGRKLCGLYPNRTVELYDFDNSTGVVSNAIKVDSVAAQTYTYSNQTYTYSWTDPRACSVEFSPDGNKLYVGYTCLNSSAIKHPALCQFDLSAGSQSAIAASKTVICADTLNIGKYPGLQNAIDGKIYVGIGTGSVSVINNPNAAGSACNFQKEVVGLGTIGTNTSFPVATNYFPSYISNYFEKKPALAPFTSIASCGSISFTSPTLTAMSGYSVIGCNWNFNDTLSGSANTSTLSNPNHQFTANGIYTVQLVLNYSPCGSDLLTQTVTINGLPTLAVSGITNICANSSSTLALNGASSYTLLPSPGLVTQPSAVVQPSATTVYTLIGLDSQTQCTSKKTYIVSTNKCTGIIEFEKHESRRVIVYPNPFQSTISISSEEPIMVKFCDLSGRTVLQLMVGRGEHTINTSDLEKGLYLLHLQSDTSRKVLKVLRD